MSSRHRSRPAHPAAATVVAPVLLLGMLSLAACAPGPGGIDDGSVAERVERGAPSHWPTAPDLLDFEPLAGWLTEGEFGVVTMGSSSCPVVARELRASSPNTVAITFGASPRDPCTADMAATTHVFRLPEAVTERPVIIEVSYEDWDDVHRLELPPEP